MTSWKEKLFIALFGSIFVLVGGVIFYFFTVKPVMLWRDAQTWVATDCTILSSELEESTSKDEDGNVSKTYRILVRYQYNYSGHIYRGHRYTFNTAGTGGWAEKQNIVDQLEKDSIQTCYVNPDAPDESVLNTDFQDDYYIGIFGLIFVLAGLLVIAAAILIF